MAVLALYPYDRFSVEGGRSTSEERSSQKGGNRPYWFVSGRSGARPIAVNPFRERNSPHHARPIPREAPVTRAVLPERSRNSEVSPPSG